jgi:hypothetical protein
VRRPASTASVPAAGAKVAISSVCHWAYLYDAPVVRQSRVCIEVFLHVQVKVLKHEVQPVLAVHHVSQAVAGGTSVSRHARVGAGHPGRAGCCLALSTSYPPRACGRSVRDSTHKLQLFAHTRVSRRVARPEQRERRWALLPAISTQLLPFHIAHTAASKQATRRTARCSRGEALSTKRSHVWL